MDRLDKVTTGLGKFKASTSGLHVGTKGKYNGEEQEDENFTTPNHTKAALATLNSTTLRVPYVSRPTLILMSYLNVSIGSAAPVSRRAFDNAAQSVLHVELE